MSTRSKRSARRRKRRRRRLAQLQREPHARRESRPEERAREAIALRESTEASQPRGMATGSPLAGDPVKREMHWRWALAQGDVWTDSRRKLSGRCGQLRVSVELHSAPSPGLSLRDEVREGLLWWMGRDIRDGGLPRRWSHEAVVSISGLASGITSLTASRATPGEGHVLQIGDPEFDHVVLLRGTRALARAIFDSTTRRKFGQLIGGQVAFMRRREERTIQAEATLAEGTLRVVVPDGRNHELVLQPLLALARQLVEPLDLAERIAKNTAGEPLPAVRLGNLEALVSEFREHPATRDTLIAALDDPADEVRLEAAGALGGEGVRTLFKIALGRKSQDAHAAEAIALLADRFLPRHARWALRRGIPGRRMHVVTACLERLVAAEDPLSVSAVASALWSHDDEVAVAAGRALEEANAPCFEIILIAALKHTLTDVQHRAAIALGRFGSIASFAALRAWESGHLGDESVARTAKQAIATLRSRFSDVVAGDLSVAAAEAGQVGLVEEDERGQVSLEADEEVRRP